MNRAAIPTRPKEPQCIDNPCRETIPAEGSSPNTPQFEAPCLEAPPLSLSKAREQMPLFRAAAPALPATLAVLQGFRVGPRGEFKVVEPIPILSVFVLPIMTAPAAVIFSTTAALKGATNALNCCDPKLVGKAL